MNKQQDRDDIKKAMENFAGKYGEPFTDKDKFLRELKEREKVKNEFITITSKRGLPYKKKMED